MLRNKTLLSSLLVVMISTLVSACSMAPKAPQSITPELSLQLEQRVQERWLARIDRDYERMYDYSTPNFRSVFPKRLYVKGFSYGLDWELTGVEILNYDGDAAVASVAVRVMSKPTKQTSQAGYFAGAVPMTIVEQWIYVDGEWWYSASR